MGKSSIRELAVVALVAGVVLCMLIALCVATDFLYDRFVIAYNADTHSADAHENMAHSAHSIK